MSLRDLRRKRKQTRRAAARSILSVGEAPDFKPSVAEVDRIHDAIQFPQAKRILSYDPTQRRALKAALGAPVPNEPEEIVLRLTEAEATLPESESVYDTLTSFYGDVVRAFSYTQDPLWLNTYAAPPPKPPSSKRITNTRPWLKGRR